MMAKKKQAWTGWGPDTKRHKVAGWKWDEYQNGFITTAHREFECSCGEPVKVPDFHNCKCGKIWNTYIIGTGGGKKEATAEMFIAREIPGREEGDVIVARKKRSHDLKSPPGGAYDDYDKWSNDVDHQMEAENATPFPSNHIPKTDTRSKGKTRPDWHSVDHSTQRWVKKR